MSYSRWSNSRWYTFWSYTEDDTKEKQAFEVCNVIGFIYSIMKINLEGCLDQAIEIENEKTTPPVSPQERAELKGYMLQFIKDVEDEYKDK